MSNSIPFGDLRSGELELLMREMVGKAPKRYLHGIFSRTGTFGKGAGLFVLS